MGWCSMSSLSDYERYRNRWKLLLQRLTQPSCAIYLAFTLEGR